VRSRPLAGAALVMAVIITPRGERCHAGPPDDVRRPCVVQAMTMDSAPLP
jgi:hypothetical protein